MEDGGFTVVKKGARSGGKQRVRASSTGGQQSEGGGFRYQGVSEAAAAAAPAATLAAMQQKLDAAVAQLEGSDLWEGVRAALRATPQVSNIVCLGVGSFGSSASARYQLALALLLRRELLGVPVAGDGGDVPAAAPSAASEGPDPSLPPPPPRMDVYDPVLGEAELSLLRARGCGVPERNEEGRRSVAAAVAEGVTLFFMPHCGRQLYANVLEANWGAEQLCRLAILGNSFTAYADALTAAQRDRTAGWCRLIGLGLGLGLGLGPGLGPGLGLGAPEP